MSPHRFRIVAKVAAALVAVTVATPSFATDVTFASYTGAAGSFSATVSPVGGVSTVTLSETQPVLFSFLNTNLASGVTAVVADLTFTASGPAANYSNPAGVFGYLPGLSGSYSFTSTTALTVGSTTYAAGSNLLTAVFSNGELYGVLGSNPTFEVDTNIGGNSLTFTSAFLTFAANPTRADLSDTLSSAVLEGQGSLQPFSGTPTGSFSVDPLAVSNAAVPEPATWAMMLLGLGAIGLGLRRKAGRALRNA